MHHPQFRPDAGLSRQSLGGGEGTQFDVRQFRADRAEGGERIINPGRDGFTIKARLPEPLTEEEMSKIKLGTSAIYFYGVISYRDAFSRRRKTQFRYQHGGARLFGTEDLALSPQGNKAT